MLISLLPWLLFAVIFVVVIVVVIIILIDIVLIIAIVIIIVIAIGLVIFVVLLTKDIQLNGRVPLSQLLLRILGFFTSFTKSLLFN